MVQLINVHKRLLSELGGMEHEKAALEKKVRNRYDYAMYIPVYDWLFVCVTGVRHVCVMYILVPVYDWLLVCVFVSVVVSSHFMGASLHHLSAYRIMMCWVGRIYLPICAPYMCTTMWAVPNIEEHHCCECLEANENFVVLLVCISSARWSWGFS